MVEKSYRPIVAASAVTLCLVKPFTGVNRRQQVSSETGQFAAGKGVGVEVSCVVGHAEFLTTLLHAHIR